MDTELLGRLAARHDALERDDHPPEARAIFEEWSRFDGPQLTAVLEEAGIDVPNPLYERRRALLLSATPYPAEGHEVYSMRGRNWAATSGGSPIG